MNYPKYELVTGDAIEQGDFFDNVPVLNPVYATSLLSEKEQEATLDVEQIELVSMIVVSQTCDISKNTSGEPKGQIILCRRDGEKEYKEKDIEEIRKERYHYYHLLTPFEDIVLERQIIDFSFVYVVSLKFLVDFARDTSKTRIRLLSPYREKFAQRFGYYYSRVALPN